MKLLDEYFELRKDVFEYFGYKEDWKKIPLEDFRDCYWSLSGVGSGDVIKYAETREDFEDEEAGNYYEAEIYTQCFLPKWVYRGKKFTMVCMDPGSDGNHYLGIFDNKKEMK